MKLAILKNILLLSALATAVYVLVTKHTFTYTILYSVIGISLFYVIFSIAESMRKPKKQASKHQYLYYTAGMLTKKVILAGAFAIAAFALFMTGTKVLLFGIILSGMLLSELAGLFISLKNNQYFIYIEEKAIVFELEQTRKVFSSHIKEIEYRHNILYLTLTNDQVKLIETEKIEEGKRSIFIQEFIDWAKKYSIPFSEEAREKLGL